MKLSVPSFARKLSIPSPKRSWGGGKKKTSLSRSEAPSFASASSFSSSSSADAATPRSVLAPTAVPRRELEAVLRRLGHAAPSDAELDAVAAIAAAPPGDEDDLAEAFRVFDADGDGRITAEELRAVMAAILGDADACSLDDCRRMIGGADADGDGVVGFQDFARMMTTAAAPRGLVSDLI
jgi:calcium-binding protein CML